MESYNVIFCVWLLLLSAMLWSSSAEAISTLFLLLPNSTLIVQTDYILFIHSPADKYLSCSYFGGIVNTAGLWTSTHIKPVDICFHFSGKIPQKWSCRVTGKFALRISNCFQVLQYFTFPQVMWKLVSPHPHQHLLLMLFYYSHCSWCVVISRCAFNLPF